MDSTLTKLFSTPYAFMAMPDPDDGGWVVFYPDLPGCITQADSYDEIAHMARDSFETWMEYRFDHQMPIPEPTFDADPDWDWDAVRPPDALPKATASEAATELGISVRRVHQLAKSRQVGSRHGKTLMLSERDIDAMRDRRPGRPPAARAS